MAEKINLSPSRKIDSRFRYGKCVIEHIATNFIGQDQMFAF